MVFKQFLSHSSTVSTKSSHKANKHKFLAKKYPKNYSNAHCLPKFGRYGQMHPFFNLESLPFHVLCPINDTSDVGILDIPLVRLSAYWSCRACAWESYVPWLSVCLSVIIGSHFQVNSNVNIACSTATSLFPMIGKVIFYCNFVSREPSKVQKANKS